MMKTYKKITQKGFTLIELLVVIAIIGILASIVLASLDSARAKGRDARRVSDLKSLQNAVELYASDHGGNFPYQATAGTVPTSLVPTYIPTMPTDPSTGVAYGYISNGTSATNVSGACLGAKLENASSTTSAGCPSDTVLSTGTYNYQIGLGQ